MLKVGDMRFVHSVCACDSNTYLQTSWKIDVSKLDNKFTNDLAKGRIKRITQTQSYIHPSPIDYP